jgi:ankyrin repeat domain-containing protein 50
MRKMEADEKYVEIEGNSETVIYGLIGNTRELLKLAIQTPSSSRIRLLLLQHLSSLLSALEIKGVLQSYESEVLHLVAPVTQYLADQKCGNTAIRFHERIIQWLETCSSPDDYKSLRAKHHGAIGELHQRLFEDKLDEAQNSDGWQFSFPAVMLVGLRHHMEAWKLGGETHPIDTAEMEFLYRITLEVLVDYAATAGKLTDSDWNDFKQTVIDVILRLCQSPNTGLAWHLVYRLQQQASRVKHEFIWQKQLLALLWKASQHLDILQNIFPPAICSDWQRYRAMLVSPRQQLASVLSDLKHFDVDHQLRLTAAAIYHQQIQKIIQTMMADCTRSLGPAPSGLFFCFLWAGSYSRREALPYSDIEMICLVSHEHEIPWENQASIKQRYLSAWYDYFQFKMISLGESTGLRLDDDGRNKAHPGEPRLRNTPDGWISMLRSQSHQPDVLNALLLNAHYLYGNDDQKLFDSYRKALEPLFALPVSVEYELYKLPDDLKIEDIQPKKGEFYCKNTVIEDKKWHHYVFQHPLGKKEIAYVQEQHLNKLKVEDYHLIPISPVEVKDPTAIPQKIGRLLVPVFTNGDLVATIDQTHISVASIRMTVTQQVAESYLQAIVEDFKKNNSIERKESKRVAAVSLKQDYWQYLIYGIHYLALYYDKPLDSTSAAIDFLAENMLITLEVAQNLRVAIADLYQLRWQQHHKHRSQYELLEEEKSPEGDKQQRRLNTIKNRLLIPWYHALSHWLSHHQWPADPLRKYWQDQYRNWLQAESWDTWRERIDRVVDWLCTVQMTDPTVYQEAYRQIGNTWLSDPSLTKQCAQHYYEGLDSKLKGAGLSVPQRQAILQTVWNTPMPDGTRFGWQSDEQLWRDRLARHLLVEEDQQAISDEIKYYVDHQFPCIWVSGLPFTAHSEEKKTQSNRSERLLKFSVAQCLINQDGIWQKTRGLPGKRIVIAYPQQTQPVYYVKIYPELPGIEYAFNELSQRLMGKASAYTQFVTLRFTTETGDHLPKHPHAYPVLFSEAIHSVLDAAPHLEAVLTADEKFIQTHLDMDQFTRWVFLSLLTQPEDGTPHNFILTKAEWGDLLRLIGIDNDHHFVCSFGSSWLGDQSFEELYRTDGDPVPKDALVDQRIHIKSIIYCLEAMRKPLSKTAIEEYLYFNIMALLESWQNTLVNWDRHHQNLLQYTVKGQKIDDQTYYFSKNKNIFCYIRPVWGSQTMARIYQTAERLRQVLLDESHPVTTHLELVSRVHPLIGRRYQKIHRVLEKRSSIVKFKHLTSELKKIQGDHLPSSMTGWDILNRLEEGQTPLDQQIKNNKATDSSMALKQLHSFREEISSLRDKEAAVISSKFSAEDLRIELQQHILLPDHRAKLVGVIPFERFTRKNEQRPILEILIGGEYQAFAVRQITEFSSSDWIRLLGKSKNLERLALKGCANINRALLNELAYRCSCLKELILSETTLTQFGGTLTGQLLSWPDLVYLDLNRCVQLTSIQVDAPKLQKLQAENCPSLIRITINSTELRSLRVSNKDGKKALPSSLKSLYLNDLMGLETSRRWKLPFEVKVQNDSTSLAKFYLSLSYLFISGVSIDVDAEQSFYWWELYRKNDKGRKLSTILVNEVLGLSVIFYLSSNFNWATHLAKEFKFPALRISTTPKEDLTLKMFLYAMEHNYLSWLKRLCLVTSADRFFSYRTSKNDTLLHLALQKGHDDIISFCLESDRINLTAKNLDDRTVFLEAAYFGRVEAMKKMINRFPTFSFWLNRDRKNRSALHLAIMGWHEDAIDLCLEEKQLWFIEDRDGQTPFLEAAFRRNKKVMDFLFMQRPEVLEDKNFLDQTAFHLNLYGGELLTPFWDRMKSAPLSQKDQYGYTPFLIAISSGRSQSVEWLLSNFINYPFFADEDNHGNGVLHMAFWSKIDFIVGHLVENISNRLPSALYSTDEHGRTVLHLAARNGQHHWLEVLVNRLKFPVDIKDQMGTTPLMLAAREGKIDGIRTLIKLGADIHQRDNYGDNALDLARYNKHTDTITWLLEQKVTEKLPILTEDKYPGSSDIKASRMISNLEDIFLAVEQGDFIRISGFIRQNPWLNQQYSQGLTLLMIGARHGHIGFMYWLVLRGADLYAKDEQGWNAYFHAVEAGNILSMQYLYHWDRQFIMQKDKGGNTPLMLAARLNRTEVIIELLKHQDLDIDAYNRYGSSAFLLALNYGHFESVNIILLALYAKKIRPALHLLSVNSEIKNLYFRNCPVDTVDLCEWLLHLSENRCVKTLHLDNLNYITDERMVLSSLKKLLEKNQIIVELSYPQTWESKQNQPILREIQKCLSRNRDLLVIYRSWANLAILTVGYRLPKMKYFREQHGFILPIMFAFLGETMPPLPKQKYFTEIAGRWSLLSSKRLKEVPGSPGRQLIPS